MARHSDRLYMYEATSAWHWSHATLGTFDFIYLDGEHLAPTVLADAVHSFERLRPGGLLAFDDYTWDSGHGRLHNPAPAIDAFLSVYADLIEPVLLRGDCPQVWVRKL